MREVNFSIPNVNKASVNITTTLYDRRALDCTSTLPLINSLNHLAYLTTSSARIRDIITVDGGIERLVCILKEGRSKDLLEMWKWSLAFQCVVNIGVRGSENVRTRVVEADMVPVIATILDNYLQVFERMRQRSDPEGYGHSSWHLKSVPAHTDTVRSLFDASAEQRPRRRQITPPGIEIPEPYFADSHTADSNTIGATSSPHMPVASPERNLFGHRTTNQRSNDGRYRRPARRHRAMQPLATSVPAMDAADGFGLRQVRDVERLPSMLPSLRTDIGSQPDSPTTPSGSLHSRSDLPASRTRLRPTLRQRRSASGDTDDGNGEDSTMVDDNNVSGAPHSVVGLHNQMEIDSVESQPMLNDVPNTDDLTVTDPSEGQDVETFNITHSSTVDGSIPNEATQTDGALGLSPTLVANNANSPTLVPNPYTMYIRERGAIPGGLTAMPREEDVLMSLQLLAYVSKYCNLRSYFQHSHLVPRLKVDKELRMLDEGAGSFSPVDTADEENEYLLPDDTNIFPLVEKFTARHHSRDMQYWACVVMRNLCRKDESRGGIRQCANYRCGKWEEFQRQFAKCRRCRRTKYCSKDCQKTAWAYHRHWCHNTP